jgi:hypothetical protein
MTEISTNKLNPVNQNDTASESVDYPDELNSPDQRFYQAIASNLNLIQLAPKEETVVKIIHYSRNYK